MKSIERNVEGLEMVKHRCLLDVVISGENFIGYEQLEQLIDRTLKFFSLSLTDIRVTCNAHPVASDKVEIFLKVESQIDACMEFVDFFLFNIGNVLIYRKKVEYSSFND